MNIPFPSVIVPLLISCAIATTSQAACQAGSPEIGDIGPAGESVCEALQHEFPGAEIQLYNRKFLATNHVIISAKIDDKPYSIDYRLDNYNWVKYHGPCLAGL
jgi:hypothetical protein